MVNERGNADDVEDAKRSIRNDEALDGFINLLIILTQSSKWIQEDNRVKKKAPPIKLINPL